KRCRKVAAVNPDFKFTASSFRNFSVEDRKHGAFKIKTLAESSWQIAYAAFVSSVIWREAGFGVSRLNKKPAAINTSPAAGHLRFISSHDSMLYVLARASNVPCASWSPWMGRQR